MRQEEVGFELLSDITCRFFLREYAEDTDGIYCRILIVAFEGEYRPGAEGNDDGVYMVAMLRAAFSAWSPLALVLDLRKLRYEWGDYLDSVLRAGEDYRAWMGGLPTTVVPSPQNEPAISSLIDAVIGDDHNAWLFPSPEVATAEALARYKAQQNQERSGK